MKYVKCKEKIQLNLYLSYKLQYHSKMYGVMSRYRNLEEAWMF